MPRDYSAAPPNEVRRRDRAVTDEQWIRSFLHRAPYGTMATTIDGRPFINSNLFCFDESAHALYLHTARVGRTHSNVNARGQASSVPVCFSTFSMGRLLPAAEALNFSVEYSGVTVFGQARIVEGSEAEYALQILLDKYAPHLRPGRDYRSITEDELARTAVYRIDIESWSGKKKEAEPDFPGAFVYGHPPEFLDSPASTSPARQR